MRFEFQMEAYCATQAQRDSLLALAQSYAASNTLDFTEPPTIRQVNGASWPDPLVMIEAHGSTRLGLDRMFDAISTELERPQRGVDQNRSYMWLQEVGDDGQVIPERRRDWGGHAAPPPLVGE